MQGNKANTKRVATHYFSAVRVIVIVVVVVVVLLIIIIIIIITSDISKSELLFYTILSFEFKPLNNLIKKG